MEQVRVVILLSGQSLFTEGVANRLREYPDRVAVQMMDPGLPDTFSEIAKIDAAVIMLDANDLGTTQLCPLSELIFKHPKLKVMGLDSQKELIQVVSSEQFRVVDVNDLIQIIAPVEAA